MAVKTAGGALVLLVLLADQTAHAQKASYLDELIEQARRKGLAEERQWRTLGHYLPRLIGPGWISVMDSPGFFLAPAGKTDPQAELEATLAGFFAPPPQNEEAQHPQCAFVARYHWLKAQLAIDPTRLPEQPCTRFRKWYEAINPARITLVFPAAYFNQPSSMFGHTLLRIDKVGQSEGARLHSYAINYGAITGDDSGVMFAFKGLAGGYPGVYSILPYYEKVKEYSDLENRDIWEYELNLNQAEVHRLVMHLWELRQAYAKYYFLDENCSYQLLALLEVARPELDLTGDFDWWAIPADTIRAVVEQAGLLARAVYRPSAHADIDHRLSRLDPYQRGLAYRLALGERAPDDPELAGLPPERRAALLELAYEYLQYRLRAGDEERDLVAPRLLALLRARSEIPAAADVPSVPRPQTRPDEGHGSARAAIGIGRTDGRNFLELRLRPALHDLLDIQGGFVPGTEIDFLDLAMRYYEGEDAPELESVTAIGIQSIAPRNEFFRPNSWRLNLGAERFRRSGPAKDELVGAAGGGLGLAYEPWENVLLSGFVDGQISVGSNLPDKVLVDVGPSLGLLYYASPVWALNLSGSYRFALDNETDDYLDVRLEQRFTLTRSLALRLSSGFIGDAEDPFLDLGTSLHWYF
ncbi:MAG TPA: DUF4105 domain-containing protein [Alphaproteobacteria bacterium]|nr:DUF4105 domain-containing protein [Alphaproteobacteria bacterium]